MMKKIICLMLALFLFINTTRAAEANFLGTIVSDQGGGGGGETENPLEGETVLIGHQTFRYEYQEVLSPSSLTTINAYNLEGKSVIPTILEINPDAYKFKSGTWIGINVTENHSVGWEVTHFKVYEVRNKHKCTYSRTGYYWPDLYIPDGVMTKAQCDSRWEVWRYDEDTNQCYYRCCWYPGGTISAPEVDLPYNETYTCPSTYNGYGNMVQTTTTYEAEVYGGSIYNQLKDEAIRTVKTKARNMVWGSSGVVKYIKDNSYDAEELHYNEIKEAQATDLIETNEGSTKGKFERSHEFLEKVCMNLKNSKVTYGDECEPNAEEGIIEIENKKIYDPYITQSNKNVTYWHYFIPLNTPSDAVFGLDLIGNENVTYNVEQCETFIEEKIAAGDNYQNYITPINKTDSFDGSYKRSGKFSEDYTKLLNSNGCYISIKVNFPIEQKFYQEKTIIDSGVEKIQFKGFNFYYKPIDVSEANTSNQFDIVFPNGITRNWLGKITTPTLWEDWIESSTKTPDLSKSYTEKTYVATNINAKKIRDYNKINQYTSWNNMYTTGVSKFIETEGIITRQVNQDSFYKLGCGPLNINEYLDEARTQKNNLYIRGCERS